ncbi:glycosyltransferase family 2 protein [Segatella hominis]|uniref:glycosyltransferase family 2 protein n=1 Tax=Segatella hominis TaxID=2518605 RepID=UPI0025F9A445|nr:glycosyltransferase family 2 protein [uncultured Prevotella sp.]
MKKLSIIIVTYNSEKDIYECLDTIYSHCDIPIKELEVIIVDNNSTDCATMFNKLKTLWGEDIILIKNSSNGGYGQGNNVGIRQCSAPVVLIMNPDVRLVCPIFRKAINLFSKNKNMCILGMKQWLTLNEPSSNSFTCTSRMNGYLSTILSALCTRLDIYLAKYMYFSGSCFFINKAMFETVGLFDESVFLYGEEDDIHYRLMHRFKDCKMIYNKNLRYLHLTKERQPDIKYEKTLIDVAVIQNQKKGYNEDKTLKNRLRCINLLILRERLRIMLGKNNRTLLNMLEELKHYINMLINNI